MFLRAKEQMDCLGFNHLLKDIYKPFNKVHCVISHSLSGNVLMLKHPYASVECWPGTPPRRGLRGPMATPKNLAPSYHWPSLGRQFIFLSPKLLLDLHFFYFPMLFEISGPSQIQNRSHFSGLFCKWVPGA